MATARTLHLTGFGVQFRHFRKGLRRITKTAARIVGSGGSGPPLPKSSPLAGFKRSTTESAERYPGRLQRVVIRVPGVPVPAFVERCLGWASAFAKPRSSSLGLHPHPPLRGPPSPFRGGMASCMSGPAKRCGSDSHEGMGRAASLPGTGRGDREAVGGDAGRRSRYV